MIIINIIINPLTSINGTLKNRRTEMIPTNLTLVIKPGKASLYCEPKRYHIFLPDLWMFTTQAGPVVKTGPLLLHAETGLTRALLT